MEEARLASDSPTPRRKTIRREVEFMDHEFLFLVFSF